MLRKGTVHEIKTGALTHDKGYLVVGMCHYPRGLKKTLIDEYVNVLAPTPELLADFLKQKRKSGGNHNAAFEAIKYQQRFELSEEAVEHLRRLAGMSAQRDVFLICQCEQEQRCHRELLLIAAKKWFGAATELRKFSYPLFERRLPENPGPIRL